MAKSRYVNTRIWDDDYFSNLDPIEKLLFLYLLTNSSTEICGVYEIPLKNIAVDTGIDKEMVEKVLIRFASNDKIYYIKGYIAIKNFIKHQTINPSIKRGIESGLNKVPLEVLDRLGTEWRQYVDSLPDIKSNYNLIKSNLITSFDSFWEEYPRKVGKEIARSKWAKLTDQERELALKELPNHKKSTGWNKDGGQFIPHPTTWINQKRWNDEVKVNKKTDSF